MRIFNYSSDYAYQAEQESLPMSGQKDAEDQVQSRGERGVGSAGEDAEAICKPKGKCGRAKEKKAQEKTAEAAEGEA